MPSEIVLNGLWAFVGISALSLLAWRELRSHPAARATRIWAVLFAILFLFPCVSESDDLLAFQNPRFTLEIRGDDEERHTPQLERLFTALQTCPPAALHALFLTLVCIALIRTSSAAAFGLRLAAERGRAPPLPLFES